MIRTSSLQEARPQPSRLRTVERIGTTPYRADGSSSVEVTESLVCRFRGAVVSPWAALAQGDLLRDRPWLAGPPRLLLHGGHELFGHLRLTDGGSKVGMLCVCVCRRGRFGAGIPAPAERPRSAPGPPSSWRPRPRRASRWPLWVSPNCRTKAAAAAGSTCTAALARRAVEPAHTAQGRIDYAFAGQCSRHPRQPLHVRIRPARQQPRPLSSRKSRRGIGGSLRRLRSAPRCLCGSGSNPGVRPCHYHPHRCVDSGLLAPCGRSPTRAPLGLWRCPAGCRRV